MALCYNRLLKPPIDHRGPARAQMRLAAGAPAAALGTLSRYCNAFQWRSGEREVRAVRDGAKPGMPFPATLQTGERVFVWMESPLQPSCRKVPAHG